MLAGIFMMFMPEDTYELIAFILCVSLLLYGLKTIIYYFTMARFMVGGRLVLYRGVIIFDLGFFLATIMDVPKIYVMGYLFIIHAFYGMIDILKTTESLHYRAKSWKLSCIQGVGNLVLSITCLVNIRSLKAATFIYAIGLIYSGIMHIIQSLRNTNSVYIVEV